MKDEVPPDFDRNFRFEAYVACCDCFQAMWHAELGKVGEFGTCPIYHVWPVAEAVSLYIVLVVSDFAPSKAWALTVKFCPRGAPRINKSTFLSVAEETMARMSDKVLREDEEQWGEEQRGSA